ncbi:amino acid adenylation domain-containing protein [Polynucleobacter sp. AP-Sving-400A-A2]|uniref:amino acid adenylation domain-containing protein n=1 Tax=Polynucleobacter sp. AP-Sving-400A-A2 TaxID=2081049 RepID=UPI001BFD624D|nr:amino acid adenylation domain-containing protein [Polynucleobacter sp. AP-Sving-400A-A2]QWE14851.1 amino acid adenylation domain-containing protein [Polynucleobacter sp. AP-Sving-400A-A2]
MLINIIQYLENSIKRHPQKIAVQQGDVLITFYELGVRSKSIARKILERTCEINKPIAVFLPKSVSSVLGDLGITYSGNAYMNLDVRAPDERLSAILHHIQPALLITDNANYHRAKKLYSNELVLNIDDMNFNEGVEVLEKNVVDFIIDQDPYCIINTSGSTGTPKSVVLNHKSFIDFIEWSVEKFKFDEGIKIGSLSPCIFDIYTYEICLMCAKGVTLYLIPEEYSTFPVKIINYLEDEGINFIFWVPTIMVNIANFDLLGERRLKLDVVWFAGEVFPTKQFNYWRGKLPTTTFVNMYGPIEITLDCTYFIVNREIEDDEPIPIGIACQNTDVIILNEFNRQVKSANEEGELCVRGTSLAMGYYNNPEGTKSAFVQNPLNKSYPELIYRTGDLVTLNGFGEIVYKGRKDTLIKHLGYRIELGEIEHVCVNVLKIVLNCCALYRESEKRIVLIYESDVELEDKVLRTALARVLPRYMVPHIYIHKKQLPMNPNGKIDRLRIKEGELS